MGKQLLSCSVALLLLSTTSSRGDDASKAKLMEEWLQLQGKSAERIAVGVAEQLVGMDTRIRPENREALVKRLVDKTDKAASDKKLREVIDRHFTEADLSYIVAVLKSDLGKKIATVDSAVISQMKPLLIEPMKTHYEQEVKQIGELLAAGGPKESGPQVFHPSWATKMFWKVFPNQKPACVP